MVAWCSAEFARAILVEDSGKWRRGYVESPPCGAADGISGDEVQSGRVLRRRGCARHRAAAICSGRPTVICLFGRGYDQQLGGRPRAGITGGAAVDPGHRLFLCASTLYFITILSLKIEYLPHLVVFGLSALLISWLSDRRKRAETALRRARDELEASVRARTAELSRTSERATRSRGFARW
jgi:hypothetical protein